MVNIRSTLTSHGYNGCMILALSVAFAFQKAPEPTTGHPVALPTEYVEHRFAVCPETESGKKLRLFTDSAGGHFLTSDIAKTLNLTVKSLGKQEGLEVGQTPYPAFKPTASIPPAIGTQLFVFDSKVAEGPLAGYDGMLGQPWFAGRVWTFDYPGQKLYWRAPGDLPKHKPQDESKLYFKTSKAGKRIGNFARIEITVDGEKLSFLFDTGATDELPKAALDIIKDGRPANRATSFLTRGTYDKWHAKHPEWKVVEVKTATGQVMIEVPKITIASHTVGPVWFSVQPDMAFHQYMAQWMDQPTEGALGGSALKYFRITADWPNAIAVFEPAK